MASREFTDINPFKIIAPARFYNAMPDAFDRIVADLRRLNGSAQVGALDKATATKLAYSEFGTVTEPPRPTLSAAFDANRGAITRSIDRQVGDVLDGRSEASGREIMTRTGAALAELVVEAIDGNTPPENAPSTLAAKRRRGQGDRTLVATGAMRDGIRVETRDDARDWPDDE